MPNARALPVLVATVAACVACGGADLSATVSCDGSTCTVDYPAKARNNQSSSGGPPTQVLGVSTQLFSISGGQALFRIAEEPVTVAAGEKRQVGGLQVQALEVTSTLAVLRYTRR